MKCTLRTVPIALVALSFSLAWAAGRTVYERIELEETDRVVVETLASDLAERSEIAKVDAFGLLDVIHHVTVTFAPDQQERGFTLSRCVDCYQDEVKWKCEAPDRVLLLSNEYPPAEIRLSSGISVSVAKQIYEYAKTEQQPRFRTVTQIVVAKPDMYDVHITYVNGFGIWRIKGEEQWFPDK